MVGRAGSKGLNHPKFMSNYPVQRACMVLKHNLTQDGTHSNTEHYCHSTSASLAGKGGHGTVLPHILTVMQEMRRFKVAPLFITPSAIF